MAAVRDKLSISKANRQTRQAVRQSTQGRDAGVVNPRVWNMYREALEFKGAGIVPFEQELRGLEASTIDFIEGVLPLLRAPLPRVWDKVEAGGPLAEPLRASVTHYGHPDISGGNMDDTAVRASIAEFERGLQLKVRRPLAQWVSALENVRGRVPELDRLRGRLETRARKMRAQEKRAERDERRRLGVRRSGRGFAVGRGRVRSLLYRCTHPLADEGPPESRGAGEGGEAEPAAGPETSAMARQDYKREDLDIQTKERTRKLQAAKEAFSAEEGLLYEQLSGLCRDAAWTKSYIASSLLMAKELFQEVAVELGDTLQPLPACKVPSPEAAARGLRSMAPAGDREMEDIMPLMTPSRSRTLGPNLAYISAMPDFAQRGRARATLEEFKEAARRRLHAHMATSSPLELHALPEARAGDRLGKPTGSRVPSRPTSVLGEAAAGTPSTSTSKGVITPATPARDEEEARPTAGYSPGGERGLLYT